MGYKQTSSPPKNPGGKMCDFFKLARILIGCDAPVDRFIFMDAEMILP